MHEQLLLGHNIFKSPRLHIASTIWMSQHVLLINRTTLQEGTYTTYLLEGSDAKTFSISAMSILSGLLYSACMNR